VRHIRASLAVVALVMLQAGAAPAALAQSDEERARAQLEKLQADIGRINREITSASARRDTLQGQLREAERQQSEVQRAINDNRARIADQNAALARLRREQAELQRALAEQQARIAVEMRTAWQMGQQGQLKVLLNQERPDTVARMMTYYRYFFRARNDRLLAYRDTLGKLDATQQDIDGTLADLDARAEQLTTQQRKLAAAQRAREQAVAQLNSTIADNSSRLKKLEQDRKELQELIDAIEKAVVNLQVPDNYQPFREAKGKMPWPVPGRASHRFGNARNQGKMRWQGVKIPGQAGTEVKAIHHGRVVYSDWLRGMGLLLIVDHGDGFMSLYAHNQTLLRDVGEWVSAGSAISTLGNSGGLDSPALYFEIRQEGKPVNPADWCRR
jgi:septal ring factor EnvC (AmiA/AmiB activator)